jgi:hypothetical protein
MRLLLGVRVRDVDCGLKLFKRQILQGIELQAKGAMISAELMAQLVGRGAKVCEVEVSHLPRLTGEQSGANLAVILQAFKELWLLSGRLRKMPENAGVFSEDALQKLRSTDEKPL